VQNNKNKKVRAKFSTHYFCFLLFLVQKGGIISESSIINFKIKSYPKNSEQKIYFIIDYKNSYNQKLQYPLKSFFIYWTISLLFIILVV